MANADSTPILRLREFILWAKDHGLCKSEPDFERICRLSQRYVVNNIYTCKGNISSEIIGRIAKVFPQLNLAWLCNGEGSMLADSSNLDYKQAYEGAMMQIEALNRILKKESAVIQK